MVELRVMADALTRMRARAFASGTTLVEVADQVIAGTLDGRQAGSRATAPNGSRP